MSPVTELPLQPAVPQLPAGGGLDADERSRLIGRVKALAWLSLVWMAIEGAVGIIAALAAGSTALLGFGLDSGIEAAASVIVIWRFTGTRQLSEHAEQRAQKLVAVSFFLLAPYVAQDAIRALIAADHPSSSWVGAALSVASLVAMPLLGRSKQRLGQQLSSAATAAEGTQNQLCAYTAAAVLVGLLVNTAFGLWWLDPVIALGIAAWAIKEGRETWSGDGCCSPPTLDDSVLSNCDADCCR